MKKYLYLLTTAFLMIFSGCNQGLHMPNKNKDETKMVQGEIDSILSSYNEHASLYSELYQKALYGDKIALKSYSDLMLEINILDNKLKYMISQKKIASNQLKKYMDLKKKFSL